LPNGKRSRPLGRPYPTREAAERAQAAFDAPDVTQPWTWGAIFDRYLTDLFDIAIEEERESYYDITERHIRLHLRPRIGGWVASETTSKQLKDLWRDLLAVPLQPKYVTNIRGTLSAVTNEAISWSVLDRNVVPEAKVPSHGGRRSRRRKSGSPKPTPDVIPYNEIEADGLQKWLVENWPKRSENALALLCCLQTGARRGETFGLRVSGIDFDNCLVTFVEQVVWVKIPLPKRLELRSLKSDGSERTISVSPVLLDELRRHLDRTGRMGDDLVFCHPDGGLRDPDRINVFVRDHLPWETEIGLPRPPQPHLLRHTHASLLLAAGMSPAEVSARIGHSIPTTTLEFYAHSVKAHRDRGALIWDDLLANGLRTPTSHRDLDM
jgi:integrase